MTTTFTQQQLQQTPSLSILCMVPLYNVSDCKED